MTDVASFPHASDHDAPRPTRPSAQEYPLLAKIFHWATALLIAFMAASGVLMTQLGSGPAADALFGAHKLAGAATLLLVSARVAYRIGCSLVGRWVPYSRRVHFVIYGALIVTPLLGWAGVSDFGARATLFGVVLPAIWPEGAGYAHVLLTSHAYLAFGLLALVCIHIGVALQDHVMRDDA